MFFKITAQLTLILVISSFTTSHNVILQELENLLPLKFLQKEGIDILLNAEQLPASFERPPFSYPSRDESDALRVNVEGLGTARGRVLKSFKGRDFFAFHSIPYAMPPEGELRFKMPVPWEGEWPQDIEDDYDATYLRAKCPQASMAVSLPGGREDCLHISIYTPPDIAEKEVLYPVMFFIHGGSFVSGDASLYIPTKLMDQDVVVITVQYRLGTFGFLSAQTPDNPGNMGLMDQVMALRWVNQYIEAFGGDPNAVTVFGQSAGSASASWMTFTPRTFAENNNGSALFHGAILESGSALDVWAHDPTPEEGFILQAEAVDCWDADVEDPKTDALECMREASVEELVKGYLKVYYDDRLVGGLGFIGNSPIIQTSLQENFPADVTNDPDLVVIPDHPLRLIERGEFLNIPLMAGSVRDEGSLVLGLVYEDFLFPTGLISKETFLAVELIPHVVHTVGINDTTGAVANALRLNYLRSADMGDFESMSPGMVDMLGMLLLKTGAWTMTELLTYKNPKSDIFFYSFECESDDSLFDWFFLADPNIPVEKGITHTDDLLYLFYLPSYMDEEETVTVDRITMMWANFAKYKDPTPDGIANWKGESEKWKPFTIDSLDFMLMSDNFTMEEDFSLRWNYNSLQTKNRIALSLKSSALDSSSSDKDLPSLKSFDSFNRVMVDTHDEDLQIQDLEEKAKGWKTAVGVLGGCCLILVSCILFLLLRMRT